MNFDTIIDRRNTYCDKWDYLEHYYGEKDMLGLWVADMDFAVPEVVNQAIKKKDAASDLWLYRNRRELL